MSATVRPPPTADRQVTAIDLENFTTWLQENGAICDGLTFGADESGMNGVILTKAFEDNQAYASIPFKLMITEPLVRTKYPELSNLSSRAVMSLFLSSEWQKGSDSFWSPYLSVIPNRIMTSMMFNDDDIKFLEGTNLKLGTINRRNFLYEEYKKILEIIPESERKGFTWEVCLWGYTAISSRAFPYRLIDVNASGEMMVPLADSFNHDPSVKVTWSGRGTPESGMLDLITRQPLKSGNQVFTTYGPKSNEELLLGYGFCINDNPFDYVVLKPNFSRDPNAAAKEQILKNCRLVSGNGQGEDRELVFYVTKTNIPDDLFAVFRVLVMNATETKQYLEAAKEREDLEFVGYRNEYAMLEILQGLLNSKLFSIANPGLDIENATLWQQQALYYRKGQLVVTGDAANTVTKLRLKLAARMRSNFGSGHIAHNAPFLRISNKDDQDILSSSYMGDPETESKPENNVLLTVDEALRLDEEFQNALDAGFPDESANKEEEEEEDHNEITMMLILIRERYKKQSRWRRFLNIVQKDQIDADDEDLLEYLDDIQSRVVEDLIENFPDQFDENVFTTENLIWADHVCQNYSVRTENGIIIVPM